MGLEVFVNFLSEVLPVEVEIDATVGHIYDAVSAIKGTRFVLMYQGARLQDRDASLADLGICPETRLEALVGSEIKWWSLRHQSRSDPATWGPHPEQSCEDQSDIRLSGTTLARVDAKGAWMLVQNGDCWGLTTACLPESGSYMSPTFELTKYKNMMWLIIATEPPVDDNHFGYRHGADNEYDTPRFLLFINILENVLYWRGAGFNETSMTGDGCHRDGTKYRFEVEDDNTITLHMVRGDGTTEQYSDTPAAKGFKRVVSTFTPAERASVKFGVASRGAAEAVWRIFNE
eukprot:TRINITY_DN8169_c0_g1_i1.p1 TRINITY_DN8169_c0_g1~~TRINITY_DN8169_c0_g1_i1.p1  ORF type:complete len:289 (+),score=44.79 TRINITY_DN8169_c0_g1_i1:114-980(+)